MGVKESIMPWQQLSERGIVYNHRNPSLNFSKFSNQNGNSTMKNNKNREKMREIEIFNEYILRCGDLLDFIEKEEEW